MKLPMAARVASLLCGLVACATLPGLARVARAAEAAGFGGFADALVQALSELIKRIAFLKGLIPDPAQKQHEKSAEEELAEEILRQRGDKP